MSEQNISLPIRGDVVGEIIYESDEINFEGNVIFSNEYGGFPDFYKLELINDVLAVLRNEYERVSEGLSDEIAERKAQKNSEGHLQ
tara:strand:- start:1068 stop:1325 length:258 start_codon:yes stop_codon:yes gene_type:complete